MTQRQRRRRPEEKERWGARQVLLAAAALLLLAFFLRSADGLRHGLLGSYVWGTAFILTFLLALERSARYLLPEEYPNNHAEAYSLLLRYVFRVMLPEGIRKPLGLRGFPPAPPEVADSFAKIGVGFVDSHYCLALVRGANYSRAAGPGFVKLNPGETIRHVIDLRPHIRSQSVPAATKDGIPVETKVTVIFRVRQDAQNPQWQRNNEPDPQIMYPYVPEAIFRISYASGIHEEEKEVFWTDRIAPLATDILIAALASRTLDELYQPVEVSTNPLEQLTSTVKTGLQKQLEAIFGHNGPEDSPVEIMALSIDSPLPPFKVMVSRIANWQAAWQRRIYLEEVAGDADALRRLKRARATVQLEMIQNIINNIETMRQGTDLDLANIITLRMLETLEQTVKLDGDHILMPNRVMSTMLQIRDVVESYSDNQGKEKRLPPGPGGSPVVIP